MQIIIENKQFWISSTQVLMLGFKLIAGALASLAFVGVAIVAGLI